MALADKLIKKADRLLRKFNVTDVDVYKRIITRTGGDALIGKPGAVVKTDTLLDPPPMIQSIVLSLRTEKGKFFPQSIVGGESVMIGDLLLTVSSSAVSAAELANPNFCFVLGTEERFAVAFDPTMVTGKDVIYTVLVRRKG